MEIVGFIILIISALITNAIPGLDDNSRILLWLVNVIVSVIAVIDMVSYSKRVSKNPWTGKALLMKETNNIRNWLREYVPVSLVKSGLKEKRPIWFYENIELPSLMDNMRQVFNYWLIALAVFQFTLFSLMFENYKDDSTQIPIIITLACSGFSLLAFAIMGLYYAYKFTKAKRSFNDMIKQGIKDEE